MCEVVWLPQDARYINVSFSSQSDGLSLSIYTYDYLSDTMLCHYSENNIFSNPHAPGEVVTFNQTITSQSTVGDRSRACLPLFLLMALFELARWGANR